MGEQSLKPGTVVPKSQFQPLEMYLLEENCPFVFSKFSALQVTRKAEILSPLGALYYNTGRYEEALQIYREAASLQPSQRELRLALVSRWTKERKWSRKYTHGMQYREL